MISAEDADKIRRMLAPFDPDDLVTIQDMITERIEALENDEDDDVFDDDDDDDNGDPL